jgi:hypothetical protein
MNPSPPRRRRERDDYQQDEAACFARHARPAQPDHPHDAHYRLWREQVRERDEDYRSSRHDRDEKFGEAFDAWRAQRPARTGAARGRTLPPSIGTEPGQPNSASPGASGKNK